MAEPFQFDAHVDSFTGQLAARYQLDPHNKAANFFRAYIQTADELGLQLNAPPSGGPPCCVK